jgi:GT2 family glycosyltransferase
MNKGTTVEQNLEAAEIIKKAGAKIYANYILGLPWETKEDIQATAKMADTIAAEMPSWAFFTPYPGCALGEECIKDGLSLLDRNHYDRCPFGQKVKGVDYDYVNAVLKGLREPDCSTIKQTDIIIPTYENEDFTVACLESIKRCTEEGTYRIIWVDNGSKYTSKVEKVISSMNHLSIKMAKNEGFVGAINAGLKVSYADNICLLNNDTEVSPGWLDKLLHTLHSDPKIGIVGALTGPPAQEHRYDSQHNIAYRLRYYKDIVFPPWTNLIDFNRYLEQKYSGKTGDTAFVAFLCAVIKKEVIDKVGYLDTNFEMGLWDDLDYNRSVWKEGYKTVLALDTCILHKGRATFSLIQKIDHLDVQTMLRKNRGYLDRKWANLQSPTVNDTAIISRAIYNEMGTNPGLGVLTSQRLELMQRYFINSLNNQTDKNFILYMVVGNPDSEPTLKIKTLDWGNLNVAYIHVDSDSSTWKATGNGWETDEGCPEDLVRKAGHPLTNIMARLDTDDWVAPGWIAHMKYLSNITKNSRFLINYQIIGQSPNGLLYNFSNPHTRARTSPFIALVQKEGEKISPYKTFHLLMGSLFETVLTIPPFYAFMTVHGENRYNHIYGMDNFIYIKEINDTSNGRHTTNRIVLNAKPRISWRDRIDRLNIKQTGVSIS